MKINANSLIIEITRKCNMECEHCLCGDPQDISIEKETIDKAIDAFDSIGTITPTGGEPFLEPELTAYTLSRARSRASGCFISTNGSVSPFSEGGAKVLAEISEYDNFYDEATPIRVSSDQFHDGPVSAWNLIRHEKTKHLEHVKDMGRAEITGVGTDLNCPSSVYFDVCDDEVDIDCIYVDVFGRVFADCDLSYELMDDIVNLEYECDNVYLGRIENLGETVLYLAAEEEEKEKCG